MKVWIPTPLHSYTGQRKEVESRGASVAEVLRDLDRLFPGIRFRMIDEQDQIRPHMKIYVNREPIRSLATPLDPDDEIHIFQALSGG